MLVVEFCRFPSIKTPSRNVCLEFRFVDSTNQQIKISFLPVDKCFGNYYIRYEIYKSRNKKYRKQMSFDEILLNWRLIWITWTLKVQILREAHRMWINLPFFTLRQNKVEDRLNFLWPFQNIWTLLKLL